MFKFKSIILLIFLWLIVLPLAVAQDESAECYFEIDGESYIELGDLDFIDCAALLIDYGFSYDYDEAYGYWDEFYTYVSGDGEVYWYDVENEEWVYWGSLSVDTEADSQDDNQDNTGTTSSEPLELDETFSLAELDINAFWEEAFEEAEFEYYQPEMYVIQRGDVNSPCGAVGDSTGPVYCGGDNAIYLPLGFMQDQHSRIGDYAVVVIIAHEWGHSIEQQLGYYDEDLNLHSVTTELIADCLAGAYTNYLMSLSENAIIEEGDIEEAVTSLFEAGDNRPWFDERTHGTSDERMTAFYDGMEHGMNICFDYQ